MGPFVLTIFCGNEKKKGKRMTFGVFDEFLLWILFVATKFFFFPSSSNQRRCRPKR